MKVSEISVDLVKAYIRLDDNTDDNLISAIIPAAIQFATSYTGLTVEELDTYDDIPLAVLTICADMYDVRAFTMNGIQINPTSRQILSSHSKNLI